LPPRAPRRGPWDDREARDDQGEADW
jgi:hypothetical protein